MAQTRFCTLLKHNIIKTRANLIPTLPNLNKRDRHYIFRMTTKQQANKNDIRKLFQKASNPKNFKGIQEYKVPAHYFDSKKAIVEREMQKAKQRNAYRKFVPSKLTKPCFMDEAVKPFKSLPSPTKYETSKNIAKSFKSMTNLTKPSMTFSRNTEFDQIQKDAKKIKRPPVGTYNLLTRTDFKRHKSLLTSIVSDKFRKYDVIDNVQVLSSEVPGPGFYNPHVPMQFKQKNIQKLKRNDMTPNLSRQYSEDILKREEKKLRTTGFPSPLVYSPIKQDTFAKTAYYTEQKVKLTSSFKELIIDKRKGLRSKFRSPSPMQYSLINQWTPIFKPLQKTYGKINILDKISKSRSFSNSSVYH